MYSFLNNVQQNTHSFIQCLNAYCALWILQTQPDIDPSLKEL